MAPPAANALFERLASRRLIVVSGKGGVGRTTVAALLGLALAERGRRVLVATTGHDDRLAWMLGAGSLEDQPRVVAPRLSIQRLEAQTCLREYGGLVLHSKRASSAVFDNGLVRKLMRAIPGLDDFAVVGKAWHEAVRGGQFDVVIFDGAATGHLLYTLDVPLAILNTVPKGPLTKEAELMQATFQDPDRTEAVLVGLPELWPLTELAELGVALRERIRMSVAAIVVNGLWPEDFAELQPPGAGKVDLRTADPVTRALAEVARVGVVGQEQRQNIETWSRSDAAMQCAAASMVTVPWAWAGLSDAAALRSMIERVEGHASR